MFITFIKCVYKGNHLKKISRMKLEIFLLDEFSINAREKEKILNLMTIVSLSDDIFNYFSQYSSFIIINVSGYAILKGEEMIWVV